MKSKDDPRHQQRRKIAKELFASTFTKQEELSETTQKILDQLDSLDQQIETAAPSWPIAKINRIDLAVLRLAVFELEQGQVPPKVVVDEAVELAKEFGSENSSSFVNGVLGTILGEEVEEKPKEEEKEL